MKNERNGILEIAWRKVKHFVNSDGFLLVLSFLCLFFSTLFSFCGILLNYLLFSFPELYEPGYESYISLLWFLFGFFFLSGVFSFFRVFSVLNDGKSSDSVPDNSSKENAHEN